MGNESVRSSSSSSLFSSLTNSTIRSPKDDVQPENISVQPQPSTPASSHPSPIHSSTPHPNTQEFALRLADLRTVDDVDAVALKRENDALKKENEEMKSEVAALRLQREEDEREISRLRHLPSPTSTEQQQPVSAEQQQQQPQTEGYQPAMGKSKRKRWRRSERLRKALEAVADTTRPPGCDLSVSAPSSRPAPLPPLPPLPPTATTQPVTSPSLPTIFVFHDSNMKGTNPSDLKRTIDLIKSNNSNNNNNSYNISLQETFTLPQTFIKIKHTTFKNNDTVILNVMTNDARQTKNRQRRTPDKVKQLESEIIQYLIARIPRQNIILIEAPPLLDSPSSDIFPYNRNSAQLACQHGIRFARTLIGETHIFRDGYHVLYKFRHLLLKSVAAAAARVDAHQHYGLSGPPSGIFGPWKAINGQGSLPYNEMAMRQPMNFRRPSLMNINIRRPNPT